MPRSFARRPLAILPWTLAALALGACDDGGRIMPDDMMAASPDLATTPDLAMGSPDLAMGSPDLAKGTGDLATGPDLIVPADLAVLPDIATPPDLAQLPDLVTLCKMPAPTFTQVKAMVLANPCASSCHSAASKRGSLDLQTDPYAALFNVATVNGTGKAVYPTRVAAGAPDKSFLYQKIALTMTPDPVVGNRMPQNQARLTQDNIDLVYCWIADGAKNN